MNGAGFDVVAGGDPVRRQAAAWFVRLRADDVTDAERRQWQAWLAGDARHRGAYERLERLWSGLGEHAPRPEVAQRVRTGDKAAQAATLVEHRRRKRRGWLAFAAAVAAVAIGGWALLQPPPPPETEYATTVGEHRTLVLEDGTRVSLDTDTRLRVAYSDVERRVVLDRGRAFFRVAKEDRPLSVHTGNGGVRAVGTEFEVYRHARDLEVTLVEGRVLLLPPDDAGAGRTPPVALEAGQKARFGHDRPIPRIETLALAALPAWLSGRLMFEDRPLPEVVSEFNRYSRQQIVLEGDGLGELRITGVFRSDDARAFVGALRDSYAIAVDDSMPGMLRLRDTRALPATADPPDA